MQTEKDKMITSKILLLFEETFAKVEGFYLDKGTSIITSVTVNFPTPANNFTSAS